MDYTEAKKLLHPDTTRDAIWEIEDKKEAIKKIEEACLVACDAIDKLQEYKKLGTLEKIREAVDKQNAKKPDYEGDGYAPDGSFVWDTWICPRCETKYEVDFDDYDYCPNCGQRIDLSEDWSEKND